MQIYIQNRLISCSFSVFKHLVFNCFNLFNKLQFIAAVLPIIIIRLCFIVINFILNWFCYLFRNSSPVCVVSEVLLYYFAVSISETVQRLVYCNSYFILSFYIPYILIKYIIWQHCWTFMLCFLVCRCLSSLVMTAHFVCIN